MTEYDIPGGQPAISRRRKAALARMGRLRVGTLILIRWIAIGGQAVTVLMVKFGLGFDLPLVACLATVAASAVLNAMLAWRRAARARLGDREAALVLGFDIIQLGVLLFLTGGLHNPFVILLLAPVTVSASILSRGATAALAVLAIACISIIAGWHMPLPWSPGEFSQPLPYVIGIWTAMSVAAVFVAAYAWSVAEEARRMSEALAVARQELSREQRFAALGGLAAAAAHELGSPLATIAVAAKELSRAIEPGSALSEDVELLISQSDRCGDILAELARKPETMGGGAFERMPFTALVEAAAAPHLDSGIEHAMVRDVDSGSPEPEVARSPEVLLALGTLVQNAVQFAKSRVEFRVSWTDSEVQVIVSDDGPGFSADVLAALGEPYVSSRAGDGEHMGLGIFIAQTLLERNGAVLVFRNREGAEVVIRWPRAMLEALDDSTAGRLAD